MTDARDDLMLQHLIAIREDLRVIKARQLEHTTWLSQLDQGQSLSRVMLTRIDGDIEQVKRGLGLLQAEEA